jgi:hypothetical protein
MAAFCVSAAPELGLEAEAALDRQVTSEAISMIELRVSTSHHPVFFIGITSLEFFSARSSISRTKTQQAAEKEISA